MTTTAAVAAMKRRFLLYAAGILGVATLANGLMLHMVQSQESRTCDQLMELVDFTKGSYVDLARRIREIPEGERTTAAGAQLATLEARMAVLEGITCRR